MKIHNHHPKLSIRIKNQGQINAKSHKQFTEKIYNPLYACGRKNLGRLLADS